MLSLQKISIPTASAALFTLGTVAPAAAANFYSITELPFNPSDINDRTQVVGEKYLWENGSLTDLSTLSGANGSSISAVAINNNGMIVGGGLSVEFSDSNQAFRSNGSSVTALNPTASFSYPTTAVDINNSGQVAINYELGGFEGRVNTYVQDNDGTTSLVLFDASGSAINNNGQVVGSAPARGRRGPGVGVLSNDGNTTTLTGSGYCSPFSSPCFSASTIATDINDTGQVVGAGPISLPASDAPVHALLWDNPENNSIGTDLGTLGGSSSQANGINNIGQVVGLSDTDSGTQHAFLWEKGTLTDLNTLIEDDLSWELTSASEINNQGEIVGTGYFNQKQSGFVLTPVPEPTSTLGIFGFAAFGLGSWLKRSRQQKKVAR